MTKPNLTLFCDAAAAAGWAREVEMPATVEPSHNLRGVDGPMAATIRLVDEAEARALNVTFRDKDYVPDVLSFPSDKDDAWDDEEGYFYLGDIALCVPVVEAEAAARGWDVAYMARHLVVHGILHLMGYDHETTDDAAAMEKEESAWLKRLGDPNPYTLAYKE